MKEFLKKDLTLKIFSIVFAVFLWFSINPVKTNQYTVPITVINQESLKSYGLVLNNSSYQRYAVITVRDRGDVLNNIKNSDFEVVLDLSKVKSVNDKFVELEPPVYIGREKIDEKNIEMKPQTVKLDLGKIEENPFVVQIETYGNLPEGYEIISKTAQPDTVSLKAVDTVLKTVGSVKAYVDVTDLARSFDIRKECKVYDKNGEELPELSKQLSVDIKIVIGKRVPVIPITEGKPAQDYFEGMSTAKPDKVLITGDAETMTKTNEIKTEPIKLDNATGPVNTPVVLQIPEGIKLVSSSREVIVSVEIIPLAQQTFNIEQDNLTINGKKDDNTLVYEVTYPLAITLKGRIEDLNKVTVANLLASIDVLNLDEGEHEVPLVVTLPNNIIQVEETKVKVKVTKAE